MASTVAPSQGGGSLPSRLGGASSCAIPAVDASHHRTKVQPPVSPSASSFRLGADRYSSSEPPLRSGDEDHSFCTISCRPQASWFSSSVGPSPPPEPGGELSPSEEDASEYLHWTSVDDSSWRERARRARLGASLGIDIREEAAQHVIAEVVGESMRGPRDQRASEKQQVIASRKECKDKARQRTAAPIMDVVGMTAPLMFLVGMSLVDSLP